MSRRIRLTVAYDGTAYHGFQVQSNGTTIQSTLEEALSRLFDERIMVRASGRTDSGVHAREQVIDFVDAGRRTLDAILRGGNTILPEDIRILTVAEALPDFDAMRDAVGKEYRYFIDPAPIASPFTRRYSWALGRSLDAGAMRDALLKIVGTHDFTSFRGRACSAKSPVRRIDGVDVRREHDGRIAISVVGTGFLRHMVRNIVGTIVDVGLLRIPPDRVTEILEARDRAKAGITAPPEGLFLWRVFYP